MLICSGGVATPCVDTSSVVTPCANTPSVDRPSAHIHTQNILTFGKHCDKRVCKMLRNHLQWVVQNKVYNEYPDSDLVHALLSFKLLATDNTTVKGRTKSNLGGARAQSKQHGASAGQDTEVQSCQCGGDDYEFKFINAQAPVVRKKSVAKNAVLKHAINQLCKPWSTAERRASASCGMQQAHCSPSQSLT